MANPFQRLFSWLRNPQQSRSGVKEANFPAPVPPPPGSPPTPEPLGAENPDDPLWRFLNLGEPDSKFSSSNVSSFWYDIRDTALFVQYHDGSIYRYENVSEAEAESMYRSSSKGEWVWNYLRLRGSRYGHRKEYALVGGTGPGRKWEQTPELAREHAEKVARESGAPNAYAKLGAFSKKSPLTQRKRQ